MDSGLIEGNGGPFDQSGTHKEPPAKYGSVPLEGGPDTSYKQIPTKTLLSGSFVGTRDGRPDWLYYLGETEVWEDQWNAVLRWHDQEKGTTPLPAVDSKLPQTEVTVTEIYQFIEALNTWMLSQARDNLPTYRGALAFCRLPTEPEWAFAARGGIEVSDHVFNRPHPCGRTLVITNGVAALPVTGCRNTGVPYQAEPAESVRYAG